MPRGVYERKPVARRVCGCCGREFRGMAAAKYCGGPACQAAKEAQWNIHHDYEPYTATSLAEVARDLGTNMMAVWHTEKRALRKMKTVLESLGVEVW